MTDIDDIWENEEKISERRHEKILWLSEQKETIKTCLINNEWVCYDMITDNDFAKTGTYEKPHFEFLGLSKHYCVNGQLINNTEEHCFYRKKNR